MLRSSRLTFVSFLLLFALMVPSYTTSAQAIPQALPDINVPPSADLAVPDEVAQVVKLRASLTAEQISKMQAIVASHQAELQQIMNEMGNLDTVPLSQDKRLFLPWVGAGDSGQRQAKAADLPECTKAPSAKAADLPDVPKRPA